jgi:hypothetical protein
MPIKTVTDARFRPGQSNLEWPPPTSRCDRPAIAPDRRIVTTVIRIFAGRRATAGDMRSQRGVIDFT